MEIINQPELQVYVDDFGTKDGDINLKIDDVITMLKIKRRPNRK